MKVRFEITTASGDTDTREYAGPKVRIGRAADCELRFDDPGSDVVSYRHATVEVIGASTVLQDIGSMNGTFLNGKRITGPASLKLRDEIRLGTGGPVITVTAIESAADPDPSPPAAARPERQIHLPKPFQAPFEPVAAVPPADKKSARSVSPASRSRDAQGTSGTRAMVRRLQQRQSIVYLVTSCVALAVLGILALFAWRFMSSSGTNIYQHTVRSTVWIMSVKDTGSGVRVSTGSGVLVDRERRLVVTCQHVVGDKTFVDVFFPEVRDGRPIEKRDYYLENNKRWPGKVVGRDEKRDLAIVQLNAVPDETVDVPLAEASPTPGDTVHTVGNPGASGALWVYTSGSVRQVYRGEFAAGEGNSVEAQVVLTQNPLNSGDSGGPVVNDRGKLVAINCIVHGDADLVSVCIDVSEVRELLERVRQDLDVDSSETR